MTCISYIVLTGRQTELRGREGRALDVENVGGEGGNRFTYTPGRSPGQGTGSGGRGGERGVAPDPGRLKDDQRRKGVKWDLRGETLGSAIAKPLSH